MFRFVCRMLAMSGVLLFTNLAPATAQQLRGDVSFLDGLYVKDQAQCSNLLSWKDGRAPGLQASIWHLSKSGFTDGWEGACTFHHVVEKQDGNAVAQAICTEGAYTGLRTYLIVNGSESTTAKIVDVFSAPPTDDDDGQGETFFLCEG